MKSNFISLKNKLHEVSIVEPNDLGFPLLTFFYRRINVYFKKMPFLFIIPASLVSAYLFYAIFGYLAVRLASILQYGF